MQTEMHHVRTLRIMSEVYSKGLQKEVQLEQQMLEKLFPVLDDLLELHTQHLLRLLERKKESQLEGRVFEGGFIISRIGDILGSQVRGGRQGLVQNSFLFFTADLTQAGFTENLKGNMTVYFTETWAFSERLSTECMCVHGCYERPNVGFFCSRLSLHLQSKFTQSLSQILLPQIPNICLNSRLKFWSFENNVSFLTFIYFCSTNISFCVLTSVNSFSSFRDQMVKAWRGFTEDSAVATTKLLTSTRTF